MIGRNIMKCLSNLLTPANGVDLPKSEQSKRMSSRVLTQILAKIAEYGVTQCELDLLSPKPCYRFISADGRRGSGAISDKIREELIEFCDRSQGNIVLGSFTNAYIYGRINAGVYSLGYSYGTQQRGDVKSASQVFVIDDNPIFLKVIRRFFEKQGVEVQSFENGQLAIDEMSKGSLPAAVVCDLHMPGVDGFELLAMVKADQRMAHVPFVMLTSDSDVEVELRLLEQGVDAFVSKATDPRILYAHVKRLLGNSRVARKVA